MRKPTLVTCGMCAVLLWTARSASAALITQFTFGESGTGDDAGAFSKVPTVVATGVTVSDLLSSGGATAEYDANATTGRTLAPQVSLRTNGGTNPVDAAQLELYHDEGRYSYFDVTIDPLLKLNLTNLTMDYARGTGSGTTGRMIGVATSLDSDAIFVDEPATNRPDYKAGTVDLSAAAYQGLTGTIRFKFFTTGTTIDADNFVLNGTLTPVPEPSIAACGAVGLIGLGLRRRRRPSVRP